jgi:hypothetical protein
MRKSGFNANANSGLSGCWSLQEGRAALVNMLDLDGRPDDRDHLHYLGMQQDACLPFRKVADTDTETTPPSIWGTGVSGGTRGRLFGQAIGGPCGGPLGMRTSDV